MKKSKRITSGIISLFIIAGVSVDTTPISMPNLLVNETSFYEDEKSKVRANATNKKKSSIGQRPIKYVNDVNNGKNYRDYYREYYQKYRLKRELFEVERGRVKPKYVDCYKVPKTKVTLAKNRRKIS